MFVSHFLFVRINIRVLLFGMCLMVLGCAAQKTMNPDESTRRLRQVIGGDQRDEANLARDQYRHPFETLNFFGLQEDMTVVEVWPGGGWYMEILAPFVSDKGHYIAAGFDTQSEVEYFRKSAQKLQEKINARPDIYGKVTVTEMQPPGKLVIAPPGTADMVLTFRNVHNWMKREGDVERVFTAMYNVLKPGGVLGVVEHRGNPAIPQDLAAKSGYVNEDYVIRLAKQAGFQLVGQSEINANPRDTKNHPFGVWTLPPTLNNHIDDEKYQGIGESDRMTLKFIRPH